jgi:hypothetical protein
MHYDQEMKNTGVFSTKSKKSHSPARALIYQVIPKSRTVKSVKAATMKEEPTRIVFEAEKKNVYFRPKRVKDVCLVEPNEINELINLTRIRRKIGSNLNSPQKIPAKIFKFSEDKKKFVNFKDFDKGDKISRDFFQLIKSGRTMELRELIMKDSSLVKITDSVGMNGLHWAAKRNRRDIANLLISYECDVGLKDIFGRTPMDVAKKAQSPEIIHLISNQNMKNEFRISLKNGLDL